MKSIINDWRFLILACLTIGLTPYFPEPHLFGKMRWVAGGAVGMELMDWFDLFLHGTPWVLLIRLGVLKLFRSNEKESIVQ